MAADYYPLIAGRRLTYRARAAEGGGRITVRTFSVGERDGERSAVGERTVEWSGEPPRTRPFSARHDRKGVTVDGELEFPLPLELGKTWSRYPREYRVESFDAVAETPAGRFTGCLKIVYLIGGGDAGSGERLYAPQVGLVRDACDEESESYEHVLEALR